MAETVLDYLFIGPAHPFRGGISETQHELSKTLMEQGFNVKLFTFTSLYPKILFPGSSPYSSQKAPKNLDIEQKIHAYSPIGWKKIAEQINTLQPKNVIFRYYTPFLAPVYTSIAKRLDMGIKKIALVDNWFPHESNIWDKALNRYFGKQMQGFTTLSTQVAQQLKLEFKVPIWSGFHPIATHLHPCFRRRKRRALADFPLARKRLNALLDLTPPVEIAVQALYHLYRMNETEFPERAAQNRAILLENYSDTPFAMLISDPENYDASGVITPEKLYANVLSLFEKQEFKKVLTEIEALEVVTSGSQMEPKIALLKAHTQGRLYGIDAWKSALREVESNFSAVAEGINAKALIAQIETNDLNESGAVYKNYKWIFPFLSTDEKESIAFYKELKK